VERNFEEPGAVNRTGNTMTKRKKEQNDKQ
jgi:hypothetical protein